MYITTGEKTCECVTPDQCIQNSCDCSAFCHLYYDEVKTWAYPTYFTISPNPRDYTNVANLYEAWFTILTKLQKHFSKLLVVLEYSNQMHYHCVGVLKDIVGFTNHKFKLSLYNNFKVHGCFKNKLHYLFKDVPKTFKMVNRKVVFEKEDLIPVPKRQVVGRADEMRSLDIPITPTWMKVGGYESD